MSYLIHICFPSLCARIQIIASQHSVGRLLATHTPPAFPLHIFYSFEPQKQNAPHDVPSYTPVKLWKYCSADKHQGQAFQLRYLLVYAYFLLIRRPLLSFFHSGEDQILLEELS